MTQFLVTGAAGFIGSTLAERLITSGHAVIGIDNFSPYYARAIKEHNLAVLRGHPRFRFIEGDLNQVDLDALLDGVESVMHQAAQAGVLASWSQFPTYVDANILATQRLLEAARRHPVRRFVMASSSSVYGNSRDLPARESGQVAPVSPYGMTKLAGEHLCAIYAANFGVPTVSLRYFTVYGPRQRPDMAIHKFIRAALLGQPVTVYGNGSQTRDFTYVDDIVAANIQAAERDLTPGSIYNLGGGSTVTVREIVRIVEDVTGRHLDVEHADHPAGDALHTAADLTLARRDLGFDPQMGHEQGIAAEAEWIRDGLESGWLT
jgi:UDP-glucuronate 4-epimerase